MISEETKTYIVAFVDEGQEAILNLNYGSYINPPLIPSKTDTDDWEYIFEGWFDQDGNQLKTDTIVDKDLIYTAQYKKINHDYEIINIKEANCEEKGSQLWKCLHCSREKIIEIPALGHLCKAKNIARTEHSLRRGGIFKCVREGCDYEYSLYFQNKPIIPQTIKVPSLVSLDIDSFINFIFHFGADESKATISFLEDEEGRKGLLLL